MVVNPRCRIFCYQHELDNTNKMRKKPSQSLAINHLELNDLTVHYEPEKSKRPHEYEGEQREPEEEEEDEIIDVTGDDSPSEEPETAGNRLQSRSLGYLEQPPSKIYYDNIEKESSDGGFFDRDDLEDEDERNELVIDCMHNGESMEKTEKGIRNDSNSNKSKTPSTDMDVVLNITLVGKELVYNSTPAAEQTSHCHKNFDIPPTNNSRRRHRTVPVPRSQHYRKFMAQMQQSQSAATSSLKAVRFRPYFKKNAALLSGLLHKDRSTSRGSVQDTQRLLPSLPRQPAPSPVRRERTSAFLPVKSQNNPQSATFRPRMEPLPKIQLHQLAKPGKQTTKTQNQYPALHASRNPPYARLERFPKPHSTLSSSRSHKVLVAPLQFGFCIAIIENLPNSSQPLDYSKNSPLRYYELLKKCPQEQRQHYKQLLLQVLPIPKPPKPSPSAIRPKLIPVVDHPSISQLDNFRPQKSVPIVNKPSEQCHNSRPSPWSNESFRQNARYEINAFFARRREEILSTITYFANRQIDRGEMFRKLQFYELNVNRDYHVLMNTMIIKYRYDYRTNDSKTWSYVWKDRPQYFVEYFRTVQQYGLEPRTARENLEIYRMVIEGLLEQFRPSIEDFLCKHLRLHS